MKKFLLRLLLFLAIVFAADRVLYRSLDYFYKRTYVGQDGGDINRYLHDADPPQLVIMGSSTARFQVNPDSFPVRSCNLAHSMTTDRFQLGLLMLMIQNNKAPKNILLSIWPRDYMVFGKKDRPIEDILYLKYYYGQSDFVKNEIHSISDLERVKFAFSSYRFNGSITNMLKYFYLSRHRDGKYYFKYQAANANDSINISNARKLRRAPAAAQSLPLSNLQTQYLARFIDTCAKYKINLMCYYMPMLEEDTMLIKNGLDFMNKVISEKKVPFLQFTRENAPELFDHPGYWVDGEHMNEKGGAIESARLAQFVKLNLKP